MPRFFFEIVDGSGADPTSTEGLEFATASAATLDAAIALAQMSSDALAQPVPHSMYLVVSNEARQPVARISLSLKIEPMPA